MILKFIESVEKTIASNPTILSSSIQKQFGPDVKTVYVKGNVTFIDSSVLEIAIFASETSSAVIIDKYRFHYMDYKGAMIFRYDNAHHHPEIRSHPHHKHIKNLVLPAHLPGLKEILNEISAMILKK